MQYDAPFFPADGDPSGFCYPISSFLMTILKKKIVDNILFFHQAELESLEISLIYRYLSEERNINRLIWKSLRAASLKKVEKITLKNDTFSLHVPRSTDVRTALHIPTSLFSCDRLTFLAIKCFQLKLPSYFSGFRYLKTCFILSINIIDDMLEQLAAKCPLLERLTVGCCRVGVKFLKISAINLKYFDFVGNLHTNWLRLTVNCPKLVNVQIYDCPPKLRLELNSCRVLHLSATELHVLEGLSSRNLLRKITLFGLSTRVPSLTVLGRFPNLEKLCIGIKSCEAASSAAGCSSIPQMTKFKEEIAPLGCLLKNSPSLQTMTPTLPLCTEYIHEQSFFKRLLGSNRSSGQASLLITAKHGEKRKRCPPSSDDDDTSSSDDE